MPQLFLRSKRIRWSGFPGSGVRLAPMMRTLVFSGCADDILHTDCNCFDLALLVAEGCLTCFTAPAAVSHSASSV